VLNKNGSIPSSPTTAANWKTTTSSSARSFPSRRRQGQEGRHLRQWDPYNVPILSEKAGKVKFHDIIEGVTMKQELDETTGQEAMVVIEHKEDLHPQIIISDDEERSRGQYPIPRPARTSSSTKATRSSRHADGQDAAQDRQDQGHHRRSAARGRIVRGPPSEGRAEISKIDGIVDFGASVRGKRKHLIKDEQTRRRRSTSSRSASTSSSSRATSSRKASS
jgi:DNA-directed RNA polymerase subunit beta'